MAELTRVIDTDRGPLLVTVQRVADRYATGELTAADLLKAARVLSREAALVSQQARRPAPEGATVGIVEEAAQVRACGLCGSTTAVQEYDEHLDVCEECLLEEPPTLVERPCPRCGGRGYHHGFGEHGYDPDWCEFCGGQGVVFEEEGA